MNHGSIIHLPFGAPTGIDNVVKVDTAAIPRRAIHVLLDEAGGIDKPRFLIGGVAVNGTKNLENLRSQWRAWLAKHSELAPEKHGNKWNSRLFPHFAEFMLDSALVPFAGVAELAPGLVDRLKKKIGSIQEERRKAGITEERKPSRNGYLWLYVSVRPLLAVCIRLCSRLKDAPPALSMWTDGGMLGNYDSFILLKSVLNGLPEQLRTERRAGARAIIVPPSIQKADALRLRLPSFPQGSFLSTRFVGPPREIADKWCAMVWRNAEGNSEAAAGVKMMQAALNELLKTKAEMIGDCTEFLTDSIDRPWP